MASVFNKDFLNRDSATSSITALMMILAVLAVCIGVWALLAVPEENRIEDEIKYSSAVSNLLDIALITDKLEDSTVYFALPAGTIQLRNCGEVYTGFEKSIPLTTLTYSSGGESSFGLMAGGVWRMDSGNAAWIILPKIYFEEAAVRFSLPVFSGDAAYGSSNPIPIGFELEEQNLHKVSGNTVRLSVSTDEEWVTNLFTTIFMETAFLEKDALDTEIFQNGNRVVAEFSAKRGDTTLEISERRIRIYGGDQK